MTFVMLVCAVFFLFPLGMTAWGVHDLTAKAHRMTAAVRQLARAWDLDLKQPMLILQGGRDYQVTMQDFEGWQNALSSRQDVQFKMYPGLNHLFIEGEGKITPAEYELAGHVAEIVVDDIARWIRQR